jgi:hypothetical protein
MTFAVACSRKGTGSFTCISKAQPCEPTWREDAARRRGAPLRAVKREARPDGYCHRVHRDSNRKQPSAVNSPTTLSTPKPGRSTSDWCYPTKGWLSRPSKAKEKLPQSAGSLPGAPAEPFANLLVFRCDGRFKKIRAAASAPAAPKENSFHPSPRQSAARRGQSLLSIAEDCSGASTLPDQARHSAARGNVTRCRPHPFASHRRARDPDRARYRGFFPFRI